MEPVANNRSDAYRQGVDALLAGNPEQAIRFLEPTFSEDASFELRLALGKAYLAVGRGEQASNRLAELLDPPPKDLGTQAYLGLLMAAAEALDGRREDSLRRLEAVARLDPRMEHAARLLRRRIDKGRPPAILF